MKSRAFYRARACHVAIVKTLFSEVKKILLKRLMRYQQAVLSATFFLVFLMIDVSSAFARNPSIRFSTTVELSHAGLRLSVMPDSMEMPLPMPRIYTYEIHRKDDTKQPVMRVDSYSAVELWRRSQYEAKWMDKFSNSLVMASITGLLLPEVKGRHIPIFEVDKATNTLWRVVEWDSNRLAEWVVDFTGAEKAVPIEIKRRSSQFSALYSFKLIGVPSNLFAYSFKLRPNMFSKRNSDRYFFLLVEAHPEIDVNQARETIEKELIGSIGWGKTVEKPIEVSPVFQRKDARKEDVVHTPDMEDVRNIVRESIRNLKDWWYIETAHYILLSNLDKKYKGSVRELQDKIEILYSIWQKILPPVAEYKAGVIRAFRESREYSAYVGEQYDWTFGLWIANRQELVIRPMDWGGTKERTEQMLRVVYHEAFHQYVFHALDRIDISPWYNEGHAVFFENVVFDGKKVNVDEGKEKVAVLEKLARDNALEIEPLLRMNLGEFYAGDDHSRLVKYSLAWGIIYYLRKGAYVSGGEQYAGILEKYRNALLESKDQQKATNKAFADIDIAELQRNMARFWLSQRLRMKAAKIPLL